MTEHYNRVSWNSIKGKTIGKISKPDNNGYIFFHNENGDLLFQVKAEEMFDRNGMYFKEVME